MTTIREEITGNFPGDNAETQTSEVPVLGYLSSVRVLKSTLVNVKDKEVALHLVRAIYRRTQSVTAMSALQSTVANQIARDAITTFLEELKQEQKDLTKSLLEALPSCDDVDAAHRMAELIMNSNFIYDESPESFSRTCSLLEERIYDPGFNFIATAGVCKFLFQQIDHDHKVELFIGILSKIEKASTEVDSNAGPVCDLLLQESMKLGTLHLILVALFKLVLSTRTPLEIRRQILRSTIEFFFSHVLKLADANIYEGYMCFFDIVKQSEDLQELFSLYFKEE
jgi:hypothetical protein